LAIFEGSQLYNCIPMVQSVRKVTLGAGEVIVSFYWHSHQRARVEHLRSFPELNPELQAFYFTLRVVLDTANESKSEFIMWSLSNMSENCYFFWNYMIIFILKSHCNLQERSYYPHTNSGPDRLEPILKHWALPISY